jgi:N-acetylneuraminate synthase
VIVIRNFSKFVVFSEDSLLSALNKISENASRVVFAVSEGGILEGVLSDGDLRRWLMAASDIDLSVNVASMMNRNYKAASVDDDPVVIRGMLGTKVLAVPLLDANQRLVAVALPGRLNIELEGREIGDDKPTFLIAEIGNNHNGDLSLAFRLIDEAAAAGANCAKFQMRDMRSLYKNAGDSNDASADLGAQYTLDLLSRFQLTDDDLYRCFDRCRAKGLVPLCTPWDISSLDKLEAYGLPGYKVASADFTNYDLLEAISATGKPMICSTGMSTESEIIDGVRHLRDIGANFAILHCNSTYPAPFKDINLQYIRHLKEKADTVVGYSGHERDIHVSVAAVALGAKIVEKHFTLDKTMEGNDHKVSLLPSEFSKMVEGVRQIEEALGTASQRSLSQGELMNRETLAKSLVAAVDIAAGTAISAEMIDVKSPGQGLQPNKKPQLVGKALSTHKKAGDFFYPSDIGEGRVSARAYHFPWKWGVPVRYHDLHAMREQSNMDLVEIHLSYKDMDIDFRDYLAEPLDMGLVVHAPELFAGDHTLDLCAHDVAYRQRSLREMQRVIDLTRELARYFERTERPCIVTNVGGFTTDGHLQREDLTTLYDRLKESLTQLDMEGVEVIPQTMPPFPWHFGGQQFHNLFVDAESIRSFCLEMKMRVCLDVSHSKLACNHRKESFSEFLRKVLPYTAHLHVADAKGVDGEGLQIGDGETDWTSFFALLAEHSNDVTFIPEIWQGHKNGGEGAWTALERLEVLASAHLGAQAI